MLPAFDAILGHRSAHSLDTGPVIADPFISPWKKRKLELAFLIDFLKDYVS
jgi:hypothetical protein